MRVVDAVAAMLAVELEGDAMHMFSLEDRDAIPDIGSAALPRGTSVEAA